MLLLHDFFISSLIARTPMKRAVIIGSAMASFCVEKFGTERLLNLNKKDITKRIMMFKKLTDFSLN